MSDGVIAALAFAFAFAIAAIATPVAIRVAWRIGFVDTPIGHKRHDRATPYLGGAAVMVAALAVAVLLGGVDAATAWILGGAVLMAIVGTIDDRRMLGPLVRLAVEVGLGVLLWAVGFGWSAFNSDIASLALSVVWIVGLVNAFNLMDNLDGAAGSVGLVCAAATGGVALVYGSVAVACLAFALSGALAGFLLYNLRRPSRVFLGDGGSMPVGFVIAAVLMAVSRNVGGLGAGAVVAVAPIVGLPILDTTLVMVSRVRRGAPLLSGGQDHLTHRLLSRLGTPRRVALALALAQAALCAIGLGLLGASEAVVIAVGFGYVALGALAIMVLDLSPSLRPDVLTRAERAAARAARPTLTEPARHESAP